MISPHHWGISANSKAKHTYIGCFLSALPVPVTIVAIQEHRRTLGKTIRRYRENVGLTQEKLAEKADLTAKYLGEVERGLVNISIDSLLRLAKALKVRVNDLTREI